MGTADNHLRRIDHTLRAVAVIALLLLGASLLQDVLLIGFAACLVACVLAGAASWLHHRTGFGAGWCLTAVIVLLTALFCTGIWLDGPRIIAEGATVAASVRQQVEHLWDIWQDNPSVLLVMPHLKDQAAPLLGHLTSLAPGVASSAIGIGGDLVVIIATSIFLAAAPGTYVSGFLRLLPPRWRPRGREVMEGLGRTLQLWFLGQFADMVVVTVLTGAGLSILGVPLSLTLALIAGLFNFVPYIGALAGAIPALAVAVGQSPQTGDLRRHPVRRGADAGGQHHCAIDPEAHGRSAAGPDNPVADRPRHAVRRDGIDFGDAADRGGDDRGSHGLCRNHSGEAGGATGLKPRQPGRVVAADPGQPNRSSR